MTNRTAPAYPYAARLQKMGHHYLDRIHAVMSHMDEIEAEAGRYGQYCEITQRQLKQMRAEIDEIERDAEDRYTDWATD